MEKELERAIECLAAKIDDDVDATDAVNYSQAAMNLAYALRTAQMVRENAEAGD